MQLYGMTWGETRRRLGSNHIISKVREVWDEMRLFRKSHDLGYPGSRLPPHSPFPFAFHSCFPSVSRDSGRNVSIPKLSKKDGVARVIVCVCVCVFLLVWTIPVCEEGWWKSLCVCVIDQDSPPSLVITEGSRPCTLLHINQCPRMHTSFLNVCVCLLGVICPNKTQSFHIKSNSTFHSEKKEDFLGFLHSHRWMSTTVIPLWIVHDLNCL